jgi:hypothetical protein
VAGLLFFTAPAIADPPVGDPYKTVVVVTAPSPYWGYTYRPYSPLAETIRAQGEFLVHQQEANRKREQVKQERLKTRRQEWEQWAWEREFLHNERLKDLERRYQNDLAHSLNPTTTEIYGAEPLNFLLKYVQDRLSLPDERSVPVDSEWLRNANVTSGQGGNPGLLKSETLVWPLLLRRTEFTSDCETINTLRRQALDQIRQGPGQVPTESLSTLRVTVQRLEDRVLEVNRSTRDDTDWQYRHFIEAKRYLKQVDQAIQLLEQPDAALYLNPLQGKNVAELAAHMKSKILTFAPATAGRERFYIGLHAALRDEVNRLQGSSSQTQRP